MKNTKLIIELDKALILLFIYLKLEGKIDWNWVWVCSPIWIQYLISITAAPFHGFLKNLQKKQEDAERK